MNAVLDELTPEAASASLESTLRRKLAELDAHDIQTHNGPLPAGNRTRPTDTHQPPLTVAQE